MLTGGKDRRYNNRRKLFTTAGDREAARSAAGDGTRTIVSIIIVFDDDGGKRSVALRMSHEIKRLRYQVHFTDSLWRRTASKNSRHVRTYSAR